MSGGDARWRRPAGGRAPGNRSAQGSWQTDRTAPRERENWRAPANRADSDSSELPEGALAGEQVRQAGHRDGNFNRRPRGGWNKAGNVPQYAPREMGSKELDELSSATGVTIMQKLSDQSTLLRFEKLTCNRQMQEDEVRHVVTILAKLCQVEYKPIIVQLFSKVCKKQFIDQLVLHISHLPYDTDNNRQQTIGAFYHQLNILCNAILELTPSLACEKLDVVLRRASQELEEIPVFEGHEEIKRNLKVLREKVKSEKERFASMKPAVAMPAVTTVTAKSPTNFRELSHLPTIEDIVVESYAKPFLRPNKVDQRVHGPYESVDDYLDVHYRLMREDFYRPLREGVLELRKTLEERKKTNGPFPSRIPNIRVYEKVKISGTRAEKEKFGILLNFDPDHKFASKIKWEFSKRLLVGSLLVLSENEEFSSIILVTVSNRDEKELRDGWVQVELCEGEFKKDLLGRQYLMVECQVFFGTYSHVLKALKEFNDKTFPLADYIVHGSNIQELPQYLSRGRRKLKLVLDWDRKLRLDRDSEGPCLSIEDEDDHLHDVPHFMRGIEFVPYESVDVDDLATWPAPTELGVDESQYRALSGALTNKVMLIQGPPGTGKTFIGLKIAACLLKNEDLWRREEDDLWGGFIDVNRPMMVVCYTNHALDQFLVGLKSVTDSIVRLGGGCKEPLLEKHTIWNLRFREDRDNKTYYNVRAEREKFDLIKNLGDRIHFCASHLKSGVVSLKTLWAYGLVPDQCLHLTDEDFLLWLCGYGENERVPGTHIFLESRQILGADHPALHHLKFPQDGIQNVTLSVPFFPIQKALMETEWIPAKSLLWRLENMMQELCSRKEIPPRGLPCPANIWRLDAFERTQLYRSWRDELIAILVEELQPLLDEVNSTLPKVANLVATWRNVQDQQIMARHTVIGMTTSFAASHQESLKQIKPRIVIVEEAAEVLESHVIVSLAGDVEHLIMIGDHQQLRPSHAVHELGVKYGLNISMFERLINNGVNCVSLSTQHRMRPEVARLICPAIYPDLKNHPSVEDFPAVRGVAKNVFFVDHKHPEQEVQDVQSHQNSHEAEFVSALVKYLLLQGYDPAKITVLSTYKGQQYLFSKLKKDESHLQDVRISTVDNYQGEEADLIVLSLVRSNAEDSVGFLKTENRVCVALSRARHGLYIIGNMANLTAADTVWRKVEEELRRQDSIGAALPLHCDRHGVVKHASTADDFASCPQGGCLQLCRTLMQCGHVCKQVCHVMDMEHKNASCMEKCERVACPQQHPCPELCYKDPCPPCLVPKVEQLACGHSVEMACHVDPAEYKCMVALESCTLPACGHEREVLCHQLANLDDVPCNMPCTVRMRCGHTCRSNCHALTDPEHEEVKCMESCGQTRHGCTADPEHTCQLVCHQPCEDCTVYVKKTLPCGHVSKVPCNSDVATFKCMEPCARSPACGHQCFRRCYQSCGPCDQLVRKTLPGCGHTQWMSCGESADLFEGCEELCQRSLPCGHPCESQCGLNCSSGRCRQEVPFPGTPACGHTINVPCYQRNDYTPNSSELLALCRHPCPALLKPCDHQCGGSCGECLQGRLHQPCKSKCEKTLLCGHVCKEACPVSCPPCTLPCEQKCVHSSCKHRCGEPCPRCMEPCRRRCEHGQCPRRCGDQCSFECKEACQGKVEGCGHNCIGLCGDPCICRECNVEEVTTIFFGNEEEEGARYVQLPDCRHILESSGLDTWMSIASHEDDKPSEITPKRCPRCKTPVTSCQRYSNVMKNVARDIAAVKARFYDTKMIQSHLDKIKIVLHDMPKFPPDYRAAGRLLSQVVRFRENADKKMPKGRESGARRVPPLNISEAETLEQKALALSSLAQIANKVYRARVKPGGRMEVQRAVELVCGSLSKRELVRLSEQEASDVNEELTRLQRLVRLVQIENVLPESPAIDKTEYEEISRLLRGLLPLSKEQGREVDEKLEALAASSSCPNVTRLELSTIVAALKMGAGHWFRCPNGHPYCITECGGAMEEANCPVEGCGARIGGGSHQLRRDNTLAGDIDGAAGPAFPTAMQYY